MKKFTITTVFVMIIICALAQTATPPLVGDGSSGNPYQIATLDNLYWLSQNSTEWDKYYLQTADIDASETTTWDLGDHDNDAGTPDEYMGFSAIGTNSTINDASRFTGNYNGGGFSINGLFVNRPTVTYIGLFGYAKGASINNITIQDCNIMGNTYVGALCGFLLNVSINQCKASGNVFSTQGNVGGLIGYATSGEITLCYSTVNVDANDYGYVGGFIGRNIGATIRNSYATGSVDAGPYTGGFAGTNGGPVSNCYSTGLVISTGATVGGFIASNSSSVTNSFWDTQTSGQSSSSGGIGKTTAEMKTQSTFTDAGWDFEGETTNGTDDYWGLFSYYNDGYPILLGVTPQSLAAITNDATDLTSSAATLNGDIPNFGDGSPAPTQHGFVWSTNPSPTLDDNKSEQGIPSTTGAYTYNLTGLSTLNTYYVRAYATNTNGTTYGNEISFSTTPEGSGTESAPYLIPNLTALLWISENSDHWDKYYLQTANIDASATSTWDLGDHDNDAGTPDEYMGFSPISNTTTNFTGNFDGGGYTISGLFINRPTEDYIALFGLINTSGSSLQNINVIDANFTGYLHVSGLAAYTNGGIVRCSATGDFSGVGYVGGLCGRTGYGCSIELSYSSGNVSAPSGSWAGGLVGSLSSSNISNCYSTCNTSGGIYTAGLIGYANGSTINNCYSTGSVSGSSDTGGLVGKSLSTTFNNSFWDTETSGQGSSAAGTGKTTAEMTTLSTFTDAGWDFATIWGMDLRNDGYPYLLDNQPPFPPIVETNAASDITTTSATLNGDILTFGTGTPSQHGFVWSTSPNPTLSDNKSEQGVPSTTGAFTYSLTGLFPEITFYVRAYAINSDGTSYGDEINFTTTANDPVYIEYKIRTDDFYAETIESGIFQGKADPVWQFRGKVSTAYASGSWSSWNCLYDEPGSQAYQNGAWYNQNTIERWSGTTLSNADNLYIDIKGWEDEDQNHCTYNSGTDENYSSDYDYHNDLNGSVDRDTWANFRNAQQGNVDYVDCGSESSNNYYKVEFDVWWNYSLPVNPQFSLSDETLDGFTLNLTGFNDYRITTWDYQVSDDAGFSNIIASATVNEFSVVDLSGLNSNTVYYVKIRGRNEAGTGAYTSSQNITTKGINTWDGSESSDWNIAGNWSMNQIPTSSDYVSIAATSTNPIINSGTGATCNDLTVETGASLTIQSGGSLITSGTVTNNGTISMQRSIEESSWHLISIPSTGITANTFIGDYLQSWSEVDGNWVEITETTSELNTKQGYSLWATPSDKVATTYTFTGTPLSGEQTSTVTLSDNFPDPGTGNDGTNLLGNPYPSSIDWSGLDDTWGAVYYWDPSANSGAGDYVEWNDGVGSGVQFIPPMQGFFIVVDGSNTTGGTGTFTLNNVNRTHSGATAYYKSKIQNGIALQARSGNLVDEVFIRFKDESTPAFDLQSDALKFFSGAEGITQIYTYGENRKLAIDTRPACETIQLGFMNEVAGIYSIAIHEIDGISEVFIEDTKTNTFHDLTKGSYEFDWNLTDNEERFVLHFGITGVEQFNETENLLIYTSGQAINLKPMQGNPSGIFTLTDISGRHIVSEELHLVGQTSVNVTVTPGVYLASFTSEGSTVVKKVIIN